MAETALAPLRLEATEVELVKRTIAKDATDEELKLFLFDCRRQGVHPLDKLIHFSKRGGRYTPITSIDFMRMRAAETGELAGNDDPLFSFKEGDTVIPITASVTVYRLTQGTRYPYTATARWAEYFPGDREGFMWRKMPQLMLGKCAEALALRKAFPKQLHGIYEQAELAQTREHVIDLPATVKEVKGGDKSSRDSIERSATAAPAGSAPVPLMEPEPPANPDPDGEDSLVVERKRLTDKIEVVEKDRPARITMLMHKFDFGDGDWRKLDLAALSMIADHLFPEKK